MTSKYNNSVIIPVSKSVRLLKVNITNRHISGISTKRDLLSLTLDESTPATVSPVEPTRAFTTLVWFVWAGLRPLSRAAHFWCEQNRTIQV